MTGGGPDTTAPVAEVARDPRGFVKITLDVAGPAGVPLRLLHAAGARAGGSGRRREHK